ncbi:MAG: hypothetical protein COA79_14890 [Planctomycetota bacterium]|nr:MAG: hypothetical protein COA79_14890 [Planctomycetota bacterium]
MEILLKVLTTILRFRTTLQLSSETVTGVKLKFRSGQAFITWKEVASAKKYGIYRDTKKLSKNSLIKKMIPPFILTLNIIEQIEDSATGSAKEVGLNEGVLVLTTVKDGKYYYAVIADVTPRRFQKFKAIAGKKYLLKNTDVKDKTKVHQTVTVEADSNGLITFMKFQVKAGGSRLIISAE